MRVVFVHGWSVTHTNTYGGLPAALAGRAPAALKIAVSHLYLAKYVSFADEVKLDDLARGMEHAVRSEIIPQLGPGERFACVTHSTGGPVVRAWLHLFHRDNLAASRLGHLVMLAPANHGSALAQLGKGRLSRLKSFLADGVEPGAGVLDWLELGSDQGWALNRAWLAFDCLAAGLFPFVLTGQKIDRALYDNLNSYTGEAGSDGVVRAAAANLNYGLLRLVQSGDAFAPPEMTHTPPSAFGVLPGLAHSGEKLGILRSVGAGDKSHPTLQWLIRCLKVGSAADYAAITGELAAVTARTQRDERIEKVKTGFIFERTFETNRYCMLVFRLHDDRGNSLSDYEILFTAGPGYDPNHLPEGFFVDRQRNSVNRGKLTYYIDHDVMSAWFAKPQLKDCFGLRVLARPQDGYAYYTVAEHRGKFSALRQYLAPNQTLLVEIELRRHVREGVFQLTQRLEPENFARQPKGADLPPGI
jgi:hypothetical protein